MPAAQLQLRSAADVRRLFTALGDSLVHESGGLSVAEVDAMALEALEADETAVTGITLSILVALAAGFSAIQGFRRNNGSMPWGLTWGALGFMFPIPAAAYSALVQRPVAS